MSQFYTDETRETEPTALPDAEVFYMAKEDMANEWNNPENPYEPGWYYWYCFPGCLPDSDPYGPFETEEDAIKDARENAGE